MGQITALKSGKRKNVGVFIDGEFAFDIHGEIAAQFNLKSGMSLPPNKVWEIREADLSKKCFDAAVHLLTYRPRGENELKRRLYQRHFSDKVIIPVIDRLKKQHLIDDEAFIQYWKENRVSSKPRSKRLILQELSQKGVNVELAAEALENINDEDSAYRAGQKKVAYFSRLGYEEFAKKMAGYLRMRGFGYYIIQGTVKRLWEEQQNKQ